VVKLVQITKFQAKDGAFFDTREEAYAWENQHRIREIFVGCYDPSDATQALIENWEQIKQLMEPDVD
jgi:hypothetical protein